MIHEAAGIGATEFSTRGICKCGYWTQNMEELMQHIHDENAWEAKAKE